MFSLDSYFNWIDACAFSARHASLLEATAQIHNLKITAIQLVVMVDNFTGSNVYKDLS